MEKPANNDYPVHELIERRWSPRAFSDEPLDESTLCSLFEAARWAPSCYNDQPWNFIVGRKKKESDTYADILDCLVDQNQTWARHSPVLGLSVSRLNFDHNGNENKHALHDVGLAMENMVLEAMNQDVFVHQMAGFHEKIARERFNIPSDHEPVAAFALGYSGDPEQLPDDLSEQENSDRSRQSLEHFVFSGEWGDSSDFV